ncbi:MAG TPA: hypothetical protein VFQ61_34700, partial [Polyangiaceae bacterium]|nr:hypothetical protein [Polyangiaceae bacterium]
MKSDFTRRNLAGAATRVLLLASGISAAACAMVDDPTSEPGVTAEDASRKDQNLAFAEGTRLWPDSVPVCFENSPCRRRCSQNAEVECVSNSDCGTGNVCESVKRCVNNNTCTRDADCAVPAEMYEDAKSLITAALDETWAANSSLRFDYKGECPLNEDPSWMKVTLWDEPSGGFCSLGAGAD